MTYIYRSTVGVDVTLTARGSRIDVADIGDAYPRSIVLDVNDTEVKIGFGYEHGSSVVEVMDRFIAALQEVRAAELVSIVKAGADKTQLKAAERSQEDQSDATVGELEHRALAGDR